MTTDHPLYPPLDDSLATARSGAASGGRDA